MVFLQYRFGLALLLRRDFFLCASLARKMPKNSFAHHPAIVKKKIHLIHDARNFHASRVNPTHFCILDE